jgi:hypothetical protein
MQGIYGKFFNRQVISPSGRSALSVKSVLTLTIPKERCIKKLPAWMRQSGPAGRQKLGEAEGYSIQ